MDCVVVFFVVTVAPLASPARAHRRADLLVFVVGVLAFIVIIVSGSGDVMSDIIVVVVLLTRVGGGGAAQGDVSWTLASKARQRDNWKVLHGASSRFWWRKVPPILQALFAVPAFRFCPLPSLCLLLLSFTKKRAAPLIASAGEEIRIHRIPRANPHARQPW